MDTLAPFLLKDEVVLEKNFEIVIKRMEMGQRWISQNEKKVYDEAAQYARGMQRQRAFTPY